MQERDVCVCVCAKIAGEENGEEVGVNEVTYLLIGNELRLRVVNESVQVSSFLFVSVCVEGCVCRGYKRCLRRQTQV